MEIQTIYQDIKKHLTTDEKPSIFLEELYRAHKLEREPFTMLSVLKNIDQSPKYHPEGSVWNHTMMVVDEAAKVKNQAKDPEIFLWGALLHDIGKAVTTKYRKGKITSYDHDKAGAKMVDRFFSHFEESPALVHEVTALVRWHMHVLYVTKGLPFAQIQQMKQQISVSEVALLGLCDRLGRSGADRKQEEAAIQLFLEKCRRA